MNINVMKRYCFRQEHGRLGYALETLKEIQAKHPDADIRLEYNQRSTTTKYRIVGITQLELELPEAPQEEAFAIPERPVPVPLPDEQVNEEVVTTKASYPAWKGAIRRHLRMTHRPSGQEVTREIWDAKPRPYEYKSIREALAQASDPTYAERQERWRERYQAYQAAMTAWRDECDRVIKEAEAEG